MLLKEDLSLSQTDRPNCSSCIGADVFDPIHIRLVEDDECAEIFPEFIEFLYTERVKLDLKNVWPFIRLGKKYDVEDLVLTCTTFIRQRIGSMPFGIALIEIMQKAKYEKSTVGIVQCVMHRLCKELFSGPAYTTVLLRMDVGILCDVLRTNDVIVTSEYDLFTRLKPKLDALEATGEGRQVLRLLSLLRLTHMSPSQLRELNSTKYMTMIRETFPGYFERALWIKAYKADEFKEELPIKIEKRREETRDLKMRGRRIPRHARDGFDCNVQYQGYAISDGYLWDFDQVFE
ncbi:hypothetical protein HOLleu_13235 [Holothuria leucospilota]|uniref:BTB domain-containing protein n=1 Tax=Holothuria leucospilota TaxID=206669 RepID=A0A9Q1CAN9_HOLLE|nr:hypothetical protein HOLleu_13235 [Holothuria leucospilota]